MPFQLTASEGGPLPSGGSAWVPLRGKGKNGEFTPEEMATFLHGRAVAKFALNVDKHQNYTAKLTFTNGDALELYNGPEDFCRLTFLKLEKRK
jgi:hypothetical protein